MRHAGREARSGDRRERRSDRQRESSAGIGDLHDRIGNRGVLRRARIAERDDSAVAGDAARSVAGAARVELPHRRAVEYALGTDLSEVEAVTGPVATRACDALGAEAFTVGKLMAFGRPDPDVATVIHEATHATQQLRLPATLPARLPMIAGDSGAEREAQAREAGATGRAHVTTGLAVACKPKPGGGAKTTGSVHLLPSLGASKALATLRPQTQVLVLGTIGPAYRVKVLSGPDKGKDGIVPGHMLEEVFDAPPSGVSQSEPVPALSGSVAAPQEHETFKGVFGFIGVAEEHGGVEAEVLGLLGYHRGKGGYLGTLIGAGLEGDARGLHVPMLQAHERLWFFSGETEAENLFIGETPLWKNKSKLWTAGIGAFVNEKDPREIGLFGYGSFLWITAGAGAEVHLDARADHEEPRERGHRIQAAAVRVQTTSAAGLAREHRHVGCNPPGREERARGLAPRMDDRRGRGVESSPPRRSPDRDR